MRGLFLDALGVFGDIGEPFYTCTQECLQASPLELLLQIDTIGVGAYSIALTVRISSTSPVVDILGDIFDAITHG